MPKQDILPVNAINVSIHIWICIFMYINKRSAFLLFIGAILTIVLVTTNPIQAETGKGTDIFKVIVSIFGVDESKGDVVAIVTVKDEQAKVKLFDASGPAVVPLSASEGGGHLIEYVATFPNLTVNAGDEYKACVTTVKDLELICKSGHNSPAARPEFVDFSLNATTPTPPTPPTTDTQQETTEEVDVIENDNENEGG
jgi:hypothetical protein